jgi:hypothetical protein
MSVLWFVAIRREVHLVTCRKALNARRLSSEQSVCKIGPAYWVRQRGKGKQGMRRFVHRALLLAIPLTFLACTPASFPIKIQDISISPEPALGQTATLTIVVVSSRDEPDVTLQVDLLQEFDVPLQPVSEQTEWHFALEANQPRTFAVDLCAFQEGIWPVHLAAISRLPDGNQYEDFTVVRIESHPESGRLIPASESNELEIGALPTADPSADRSICP